MFLHPGVPVVVRSDVTESVGKRGHARRTAEGTVGIVARQVGTGEALAPGGVVVGGVVVALPAVVLAREAAPDPGTVLDAVVGRVV